MNVSAYRSADDLRLQRNPITYEAEAHLAVHYLVTYQIKTLVGPDRYSDQTRVHADLLSNENNYPYSEPACWIVFSQMPWSAHFKVGAPICIGEIWHDAKGSILLGHLLIHIARLLNFDEIARDGGYRGYNPAAIEYWKTQLRWQPITPNLVYPTIPIDLTHGVSPTTGAKSPFQAKHIQQASSPLAFRAKSGSKQ